MTFFSFIDVLQSSQPGTGVERRLKQALRSLWLREEKLKILLNEAKTRRESTLEQGKGFFWPNGTPPPNSGRSTPCPGCLWSLGQTHSQLKWNKEWGALSSTEEAVHRPSTNTTMSWQEFNTYGILSEQRT